MSHTYFKRENIPQYLDFQPIEPETVLTKISFKSALGPAKRI